ncbi:MAG: hypothetical protein KDI03_01480 [Anaerolineae bacterium]|nr:hypothetical protein [Anaerolineae bacterium]MCB0198717.1 hypothetical protein [Anaerolineae bacterium]MCB0203466.1 hypothetical protein [Anaerolineae bacterium]MCB0253350.1 hypothetical protein [Anaerolineae bacterium]
MITATNKRHRQIAGAVLAFILLVLAATAAQASVGLTHFDATPGPGVAEITVSWGTETEVDAVAFRLVRSTQPLVQTAVQVYLTPALGSPTTGAEYSFVDSGLVSGERYYYWLYEINRSGDIVLLAQYPVTAVAPPQFVLLPRAFFPLATRSN